MTRKIKKNKKRKRAGTQYSKKYKKVAQQAASLTQEQTFQLSVQHFQAGNLTQAEQLCEQVLKVDPDNAHGNNLLGVITAQKGGESDRAVQLIRKAIKADPNNAAAYNNLGNILQEAGKLEESIDSYRKALSLKPGFVDANINLGLALTDSGELGEAEACFRKVLSVNPNIFAAHSHLGNVLRKLSRTDEAIASYKMAISINPDHAEAYRILGHIYHETDRLEEAIACFRKSLSLEPDNAAVYNILGVVHKKSGKLEEAIVNYRKALQIDPDYTDAYNKLGNVLQSLGNTDEAVYCFKKAISLKPDSASAHNNLGSVFFKLDKFLDSEASFRKAIANNPDFAEAYHNLGLVYYNTGMVEKAISCLREALQLKNDYSLAHSKLLFIMNYCPQVTQQEIFEESINFAKIHENTEAGYSHLSIVKDIKNRKLRVGYISPDFCTHSVSFFIKPLLEAHNRKKFEIYCYSDVKNPDTVTGQIEALSDHWTSIVGKDDEEVILQIINDHIDILVDLAGHTGNNRIRMFTHKAAPIQVSWLGYPNTTGIAAMDYRFTDAIADPKGIDDEFYSEKLIRLQDGFLCYQPNENAPEIAYPPSQKSSAVTFGSFNNAAKINSEVIKVWSKILHEVPNSKLVLKARQLNYEYVGKKYLEMFAEEGITSDRIELLDMVPDIYDHLALYNGIDIALDPFPYNGTTTTCEALWMGVPVVTLLGDRHSGRVGTSILHTVGQKDTLVADSKESYIEKAVGLAKNKEQLENLRRHLRQQMKASPLCDSISFAKKVEEAYQDMWTGLPGESIKKIKKKKKRIRAQHSQKIDRSAAQKTSLSLEQLFQTAIQSFHAGNLVQAEHLIRQFLNVDPDNSEANHILGLIFAQQGGKPELAVYHIKKAIQANPVKAAYHLNLGLVLDDLGRKEDAIASYRHALTINPEYAEAHNNLGVILQEAGELDEAAHSFEQALDLKPDFAEAYSNLGIVLLEKGKLDEALFICRKALTIKNDVSSLYSNLVFAMNYSPAVSQKEIFEISLAFAEVSAKGLNRIKHILSPDDLGKRKLRIGYVSPDFWKHSVASFFEPLIKAHTRDRYEIYCYSDVFKPDEVTERIQAKANHWISITGKKDAEVIEMIKRDRIDILVELSGHTKDNRLLMMAGKPAPVQVSWLGYPNTTGLQEIDYRFTDAIADPSGEVDEYCSEELIRLPGCFLCYQPYEYAPEVSTLPCLESDTITFGSFNNLAKVTPEVVKVWAEILGQVPNSRLILKAKQLDYQSVGKRFLEMFSEQGVSSDRIKLLGRISGEADHLAAYNSIDIALDPFPYNGTTTTCEALWMGVPVLTLLGERHSGRVGTSIMHAVGMKDLLVAESLESYIERTVKLAKDKKRLENMRMNLRRQIMDSSLCDSATFARNIEAAYQEMWAKYTGTDVKKD